MVSTVTERPQVLSANTLKNEKVVNSAGQNLGHIQDYMLDLDTGRVAYCVLSFGGFLGLGDKLFAVPWQSMKLDTINHNFILDVTKERLKDAPGFDKDQWPGTGDREFQTRVYRYYDVPAYWE
ncbi:MAG TPA: PRC-barrel domain-containing protein [Thermoanaerobaculia bacterium]